AGQCCNISLSLPLPLSLFAYLSHPPMRIITGVVGWTGIRPNRGQTFALVHTAPATRTRTKPNHKADTNRWAQVVKMGKKMKVFMAAAFIIANCTCSVRHEWNAGEEEVSALRTLS